MLAVKPQRNSVITFGDKVSPELNAALRADAELVRPGFIPDVPQGFIGGMKGFNGVLLDPDCGFKVNSPDRLEVSIVTRNCVMSISRSSTISSVTTSRPLSLQSGDWLHLARSYASGLGFHPMDDRSLGMSRLNKYRQISDAIQAVALTGKKAVVAHYVDREYVVIVNPVPAPVRVDAFRTNIPDTLTEGWL